MAIKKEYKVDLSSIEKYLKSTIAIDTRMKEILKENQAMNRLLSSIASQMDKKAKSVEKENKALAVQKKTLQEIDTLRKKAIERDRQYQKERAAKDKEAEAERKGLETPKKSFLEKYQEYRENYRGIQGVVKRAGERVGEQGEAKLGEIEGRLATAKESREEIGVQLEAARKNREELESKGVFNEKTGRYRKAKAEDKSKADAEIAALEEKRKKSDESVRSIEKEKSAQIGENRTQAGKYAALAKAAGKLDAAFSRLGKAALNLALKPFKDLANGVMEAVSAMVDFRSGVATYSTSTSLITNAEAREQQLKYGLSASSNYAFSRAKQMLNIQSDEDLMYMNSAQRDRFLSYMDRYSAWYDEMESSGILANIQEMQLEFQELKEELAMEFLSWVAENKETIMFVIKGTFELIKGIATAVAKILAFFGAKQQDLYSPADASDRVSAISNSNSNTTNVTINANTTNNATGVLGSQEALDRFQEENWSKLAKQIVGAVGG